MGSHQLLPLLHSHQRPRGAACPVLLAGALTCILSSGFAQRPADKAQALTRSCAAQLCPLLPAASPLSLSPTDGSRGPAKSPESAAAQRHHYQAAEPGPLAVCLGSGLGVEDAKRMCLLAPFPSCHPGSGVGASGFTVAMQCHPLCCLLCPRELLQPPKWPIVATLTTRQLNTLNTYVKQCGTNCTLASCATAVLKTSHAHPLPLTCMEGRASWLNLKSCTICGGRQCRSWQWAAETSAKPSCGVMALLCSL